MKPCVREMTRKTKKLGAERIAHGLKPRRSLGGGAGGPSQPKQCPGGTRDNSPYQSTVPVEPETIAPINGNTAPAGSATIAPINRGAAPAGPETIAPGKRSAAGGLAVGSAEPRGAKGKLWHSKDLHPCRGLSEGCIFTGGCALRAYPRLLSLAPLGHRSWNLLAPFSGVENSESVGAVLRG